MAGCGYVCHCVNRGKGDGIAGLGMTGFCGYKIQSGRPTALSKKKSEHQNRRLRTAEDMTGPDDKAASGSKVILQQDHAEPFDVEFARTPKKNESGKKSVPKDAGKDDAEKKSDKPKKSGDPKDTGGAKDSGSTGGSEASGEGHMGDVEDVGDGGAMPIGGGQGPSFEIPDVLPVLPIRGTVMFPGTVVPLGVGRPSSRKLLDESLPESKIIALVTQRDEDDEDPEPDNLYQVGVAVMVLKLVRQPDETVSIIVHGLSRIRIRNFVQRKPYLRAHVEKIPETPGVGKNYDAGVNQLRDQARRLIELTPNAPEQAVTVLMNIEEPSNLADFLAANLNLNLSQKQDLLEEVDVAKRIRNVHQYVSDQLEIAKLQAKIQQDVQSSIGDSQRKYFLREQLKAIQKELGEDATGGTEIVEGLRKKITEAKLPENVMKEATRDLDRLESIPPASPEYSLVLTYLELVADLPWEKQSEDNLDLDRAQKILDRDHFDLTKVKRRLIEYLAVRKLNPRGRGPIICLIGPPGVGKTSLGQSIADALGRKFVRMSFGGIRDEAEMRGHRRTYIGAMPGRIIQEIRRAGTRNPVMMLDEVDKLGSDFRGDPASALLEVLDPKQNNTFVDRYLDVPFDLSQVIFICTANYLEGIPPALRDRMEMIEVSGYTDNDKLQIARKYLAPRQLKENGLTIRQARWTTEGLRKVIEDYTRESGVRELERQIGAVCRAVAAKVARQGESVQTDPDQSSKAKDNGKSGSHDQSHDASEPITGKAASKIKIDQPTLDAARVRELLGPEKYFREVDVRTSKPGVVVGLAYTPVGGEILFIEATSYPGKGNTILTGQIGDVMKESVSAAMSLFKSNAESFAFDVRRLNELDIHIHVPAGAVPKDGPSAGVAMYTAIASLLLGIPVKPHLGMTGEITLRGLVLPIGGVKEKTLAAARAGIQTILLPEKNQRDMEEVDAQVKKRCTFKFMTDVDQVLQEALGSAAIKDAVAKNRKKLDQAKKPQPAGKQD
jgi:ATP-dependent Lon protease